MWRRGILVCAWLALGSSTPALAQGHHGHTPFHHHHGGGGIGLGAVSSGWASWVPYGPPIVVVAPATLFPAGPPLPMATIQQGLGGVAPRQGANRPAPAATMPAMRPVAPAQPMVQQAQRNEPARSGQFVTLGDRLFRAGNLHRASERYEQALQANPDKAAPRLRLAQVALMRGNYTEAANRLREAQATEPGWLAHAPDIQSIYGEPADFAAPIAKLETHLQVHPNDRDAWLVLGAQYYLSGRTRQAADVFNRLTDRPADPALTAFLNATTPQQVVHH
jgi:cytochrome c-type biogenesis protein CcmH/NrfG